MMRLALLAAAIGLAAAGPAPAPPQGDKPPAQPYRDAIVTYHLAPAAGEAIDVRVALRGGSHGLRMDLPDFSYMLADPTRLRLTMVVPLEHTAVDLPWSDGPQPLFLVDEAKRYAKKGDATIAGQRCTNWEAVDDKARSTICVTNDGIILRHITFDPAGRRSVVEALNVRYETIPGANFDVPRDVELISPGPR